MRLLYFAHEYPPERSPQSLRTERLAAGLIAAGHDVTVITRAMHLHETTSANERLEAGSSLQVVRLNAGPLNRLADLLLAWHQQRNRASGARDLSGSTDTPPSEISNGDPDRNDAGIHRVRSSDPINWKGRFIAGLRTFEERLKFPGRGYFWGRRAKRWLIDAINMGPVDGVILSHEPASALLLGRVCDELGVTFIAELGDPVLAPYTPGKWVEKAFELEHSVCTRACLVVVTSDATAQLLQKRHGASVARVSVISQGFEPTPAGNDEGGAGHAEGGALLRLVYSGRFYPFRDPTPLFEAIAVSDKDVELQIATPEIPAWLGPIAASTSNIVDRGFLPHAESLELQKSADILVNFANADSAQVPGKFYEYLGMCRPILHITPHPESDPQAALVAKLKRGWVLRPESGQIADEIRRLLDLARLGKLDEGLDLSMSSVMAYSWDALGHEFAMDIGRALDKKKAGTI